MKDIGAADKWHNAEKEQNTYADPEPAKVCIEDHQLIMVACFEITAGVELKFTHFHVSSELMIIDQKTYNPKPATRNP